MSIMIRRMTDSEFENVYQWSVKHNAKELMDELNMSQQDAIKETIDEVARMLPDGLNTENNHLMTIVELSSEEVAGFIWTLHEEYAGRKQCFVCDFAIYESKRHKGYAQETLNLVERYAAEAGCHECVLFVADRNFAARALYEKCGYQFLRQEGYGRYMVKGLL